MCQSWCSQMVSFFLLSLRYINISSLPHIINLLSTAAKDIPHLAWLLFFFFSLSLLQNNMKVAFRWMSQTQPSTENKRDGFFHSPQKCKFLSKNGRTSSGINRQWWKTVMPKKADIADILKGYIRNFKFIFYCSFACLFYNLSPLFFFSSSILYYLTDNFRPIGNWSCLLQPKGKVALREDLVLPIT